MVFSVLSLCSSVLRRMKHGAWIDGCWTVKLMVMVEAHGGCAVCGVVWCGVVWCGVVWCGVVRSGAEWCGVEWSGVEWSGVEWGGEVGFVGDWVD